MFIKRSTTKKKGKTYTSVILTKSYRENKKVKHKSLLNLSSWDYSAITALEAALHGNTLGSLADVKTTAGKAIGALHVFAELASQMGITANVFSKEKIASVLLLIIGRILTQGSRLHLVEWIQTQEVEKVLGSTAGTISEDTLYATLDYLADHQEEIEKKLFTIRCETKKKTPRIYLYDVTSSYLEGAHNELAAFGYNRDKKQGKMQIVIGLLTDEEGYPIAVRVFEGNTLDPKTVYGQIQKLAENFGVKEVIFVGDKGMIKTAQIKELSTHGFHYITTITKPQIRTLLKEGCLQLSLFDENLGEVIDQRGEEKVRYIYRKNPVRAEEMKKTREQKQEKIELLVSKTNTYLKDHPKAAVPTAQKNLEEAIEKRHCGFLGVRETNRIFTIKIDQEKQKEEQQLDGCFVIKTDCLDHNLTKETLHDRYKDLKHVEAAFRTIKTGFLEVRPIFVRKEKRTRGHILVTMLAYLLIHEFKKRTKDIEGTLEHKVDCLDAVQTVRLSFAKEHIQRIPKQSPFVQELLTVLDIPLPSLP